MSRVFSPGDYLTLRESLDASGRLAETVAISGFRPEIVIGVREGGLLPAHVVASVLGARLSSVGVRRPASGMKHSRLGRLLARPLSYFYKRSLLVRRAAEVLNWSAKRVADAPTPGASLRGERRVLLVDDFCESGATLAAARQIVAPNDDVDVRVAVLTSVPRGQHPDVLKPDFRLFQLWLQFPWSTDSPDYQAYLNWRRAHVGEKA